LRPLNTNPAPLRLTCEAPWKLWIRSAHANGCCIRSALRLAEIVPLHATERARFLGSIVLRTALLHRKCVNRIALYGDGNDKRTSRYRNLTEDHGIDSLSYPHPRTHHSTDFDGLVGTAWTLPYLTVQRLLPALRGTLASGLAEAGLMRAARRQGNDHTRKEDRPAQRRQSPPSYHSLASRISPPRVGWCTAKHAAVRIFESRNERTIDHPLACRLFPECVAQMQRTQDGAFLHSF
jgi:hypothetical protein